MTWNLAVGNCKPFEQFANVGKVIQTNLQTKMEYFVLIIVCIYLYTENMQRYKLGMNCRIFKSLPLLAKFANFLGNMFLFFPFMFDY